MRGFRVCVVALAVLGTACGSSTSTGTKPNPALKGSITVLAASSLTKPFTELGTQFESANPGTSVTFSFGSSSDLERQIEQGAPADVFASADQTNMDKLVAAHDTAGTPTNFAQNKLEIAVGKGNPKHIATLGDLAKPGIVVVLCDTSVPCGKFGDQVLANAKVHVAPKSREVSVKSTLSKVELGEADAALVYVSDVVSSGKAAGVPIPDDVNVRTTLPVVVVKGTGNAAVAHAWVTYVVAHERELVSKFGFLPL